MGFWKEVKKGFNKVSGKHDLRKQYDQSIEKISEDESRILAELNSELQNELAKLAAERANLEVVKQQETAQHLKEKTAAIQQLEAAQTQRKQAFEIACQNVKNNMRLVKAALIGCMSGDIKVVETLLKNSNISLRLFFFSLLPLHVAAEHNQAAIVKLLCANGVNLCRTHSDGYTAFDLAELQNHESVIDALREVVSNTEKFWLALRKGDSDALQAALDLGADINFSHPEGYNALLYAIKHQPKLVPFLVKAKADPNVLDADGYSVLQLAILSKQSFEVIHALVEAGADVAHKENKLKKTAVELANEHPDFRVKTYLLDCEWEELIRAQNYSGLVAGGPDWCNEGGWSDPKYNSTIRSVFAKVNGEQQLFVLGRAGDGIYLHSYDFTKETWTTLPRGPLYADASGFGAHPYYSTIRLIKARTADGLDKLFLLIRSGYGIHMSCYDPHTCKWTECGPGPACSDGSGWAHEQYYSTFRLTTARTGDGKEKIFLLYRAGAGTMMWGFDPNTYQWFGCGAGPCCSDSSGWAYKQYYSTLQLATARDAHGLDKIVLVYREAAGVKIGFFDPNTYKWSGFTPGPNCSDFTGWAPEQYYGTIQVKVGRIKGEDHLFLIARSTYGIGLWSYNPNTSVLKHHASGPAWADRCGWDQKCYWSTIQMGVSEGYQGSDYVLLFGRGGQGVMAHAFNPETNNWLPLPFHVPLSDGTGWNAEPHFSTIQVHSLRVKHQNHIFVFARGRRGIFCWSHAMNLNALEHHFAPKSLGLTLSLDTLQLMNASLKSQSEIVFKLFNAAELGDSKAVEACLSQGAYINSVDAKGYDALQKAILSQKLSLELFNVLKRAGIDINHENANHETTSTLAKTHIPKLAYILHDEPILGIREFLKTSDGDAIAAFDAECNRTQRYLDKYPEPVQKIEAMLSYYLRLSRVEPYALYVFPMMIMLTHLKEIIAQGSIEDTHKQQVMDFAQQFFIATRALHCVFIDFDMLDATLEDEKDYDYIIKSMHLKNKAKELALKLKLAPENPKVIEELYKTHPELFIAGTASIIAEFGKQVFGMGQVTLAVTDTAAKESLEYQKEHQVLFNLNVKNFIGAKFYQMTQEAINSGLISTPPKLTLKNKMVIWQKTRDEMQQKMDQEEAAMKKAFLAEKQELEHWLNERELAFNKHIAEINNVINSLHAADSEVLQQYNNAVQSIRNTFADLREQIDSDYKHAKHKLNERFFKNLAVIAAVAVIVPQIAPTLASNLGLAFGITSSTTSMAALTLAVEGALMGSLTAALTGNTNRILKDGAISAGLSAFGFYLGNALGGTTAFQNMNSLFKSSELTIIKIGNQVFTQGVVTNAVVAASKAAIQVGFDGGKLSPALLTSIGTTIAIGGSRELGFVRNLNEKLTSVLVSAAVTSAITRSNFVQTAANIWLTTAAQVGGASLGQLLSDISVTERSRTALNRSKAFDELQQVGGGARVPANRERIISPAPDKPALASSHKHTNGVAKPSQQTNSKQGNRKPTSKYSKPLVAEKTGAIKKLLKECNGTADPEKVTLTAEFREQATKPKSAFETVMKESREHNYLKPFSEISKPSEMQGHSFSFIRTAYAATVPKEELSSESGINSTTKGGRLGRLEYRARDFSPLRQIEAATRPVRIRTKSASRFSEVRNRDHQIPIFSTSKLRSYDDFVGTKIDFMLNSTNNSVVIFEVPAIPALQTYANGWTVTSKPRLGTEKLSEFYTPAIDWRRQDFLTSFGLVGLTSFKTSDYYPIQMFGGYSDSSYVLSNSPRELYLSDYTSPLLSYNATPILPWVSQACSNTYFGSFITRDRDSYRFPHAPTINDHYLPIKMSHVLATNTSETGIFRQICRAVGRSTLKVAAEAGSAIQKLRDENPRAAMLMDIVAQTPGVIQEAALHAGSKVTRTNIDKERQELSHHAQEVTSELSKLCDEYGLSKEDKAGIGSILVIFSGVTKVPRVLGRSGASITEKGPNIKTKIDLRLQQRLLCTENLPGQGEGWAKLRGNQGWKNLKDGTIWTKDKLHKDHWDIKNSKGEKIKEVDFYGNQIWPNGLKNKNKKPPKN